MARKILLASGCSYTDAKYKSSDPDIERDWPMWPELMANELNLRCVNVGCSGQGADYILNSIIDQIAIYGNRIDTVAILWTTGDRVPFFNFTLNPLVECNPVVAGGNQEGYDPFPWLDNIGVGRVSQKYFNSEYFMKDEVYKHMILNTIRKMFAVIQMCESLNIKFIMYQGLTYFDFYSIQMLVETGSINKICYITSSEVIKILTKSPVFAALEKRKNNIIGWPLMPEIGGYNFDGLRHGNEDYYISEKDRHPSKLGQETLADTFIERYKAVYNE